MIIRSGDFAVWLIINNFLTICRDSLTSNGLNLSRSTKSISSSVIEEQSIVNLVRNARVLDNESVNLCRLEFSSIFNFNIHSGLSRDRWEVIIDLQCRFFGHCLQSRNFKRTNDSVTVNIFNFKDNYFAFTLSNEFIGSLVGLTVNIDVNIGIRVSETRNIKRNVLLGCRLTQVPSINNRVELRTNNIREYRKTSVRFVNSYEISVSTRRIVRSLTETTVIGV